MTPYSSDQLSRERDSKKIQHIHTLVSVTFPEVPFRKIKWMLDIETHNNNNNDDNDNNNINNNNIDDNNNNLYLNNETLILIIYKNNDE